MIIEPTVFDQDGRAAGIAMVSRVGEIGNSYFVERHGVLSPERVEMLEAELRAVFDM
ncbi:hypothetical protein [Catelliglobosispora koreensis]|uniref:hypothetical protein n=1 Tax=Catelliglobosispora koreensis TaxID=129052 RepID=UPI00035F6E85|nr:hypothetical protein [Catelliglobosispora koreensis]